MDYSDAGNLEEAYHMWKPAPSYSFKDFTGRFRAARVITGPIKSYHIENAEEIKQGPERLRDVVITLK